MLGDDVPQADAVLVGAVVDATRKAVSQLHAERQEGEAFCTYALVTTGEGLRPYLAVTVDGPGRWNLGESPYAIVGDDWLAQTEPAFSARGDLFETADPDAEWEVRAASLEEALRRLDSEGLFGDGAEREHVLLLVATMPPDESDSGFARRLNPPGRLLDAWLLEAAEGP